MMTNKVVLVSAMLMLLLAVPSVSAGWPFTNPESCEDWDQDQNIISTLDPFSGFAYGTGQLFGRIGSGILQGDPLGTAQGNSPNKNECAWGDSTCASDGIHKIECGDYDSDPCLEFPRPGSVEHDRKVCEFGCPVGTNICKMVNPCKTGNACNPGESRCTFDQSFGTIRGGGAVIECSYDATIGCWVWDQTRITPCGEGPESGVCVQLDDHTAYCQSQSKVVQNKCDNRQPGDRVCLDDNILTKCLDDNGDGIFEKSRLPNNWIQCDFGCLSNQCLGEGGEPVGFQGCGGGTLPGSTQCSPIIDDAVEICRQKVDRFGVGTGVYEWEVMISPVTGKPQICTFGCEPNTGSCNSFIRSDDQSKRAQVCGETNCILGEWKAFGDERRQCVYDPIAGCNTFISPDANNVELCIYGASDAGCLEPTIEGTKTTLFNFDTATPGIQGIPNVTNYGVSHVGGVATDGSTLWVSVAFANDTIPLKNQIREYKRGLRGVWDFVRNFSITGTNFPSQGAFMEGLDYNNDSDYLIGVGQRNDTDSYVFIINIKEGDLFISESQISNNATINPVLGTAYINSTSKGRDEYIGGFNTYTKEFVYMDSFDGLNRVTFTDSIQITDNIGCLSGQIGVTDDRCRGYNQRRMDYDHNEEKLYILADVGNNSPALNVEIANNWIEIYDLEGNYYGVKFNVTSEVHAFVLDPLFTKIYTVGLVGTTGSSVNGSTLWIKELNEVVTCDNRQPEGTMGCIDNFHLAEYTKNSLSGCIELDIRNKVFCPLGCVEIDGEAQCSGDSLCTVLGIQECTLGEKECDVSGIHSLECVRDNVSGCRVFERPGASTSCAPGTCENGDCVNVDTCKSGSNICFNQPLTGRSFLRDCKLQTDGKYDWSLNFTDWVFCQYGCGYTTNSTFNATTNLTNYTCYTPDGGVFETQQLLNEWLVWGNILAGGNPNLLNSNPMTLAVTSIFLIGIATAIGAVFTRKMEFGIIGGLGATVFTISMGWLPITIVALLIVGAGFLIYMKFREGGE